MAKNDIYKITVLNWEKHQPTLKKGHKKVLISTSFLDNAKIRNLTPATTLLFLSCILLSGESGQAQVEVTHESLCYQSKVKSGSLRSQLDLLQSFQLLTWEKIDVLYNRIEKNRIEKNIISAVVEKPKEPDVEIKPKKPFSVQPNKVVLRGCLDEFNFDSNVKILFDQCTIDSQKSWLGAYVSHQWIVQEALKANAWIKSNPQKAPKNFQRFFNNWLSRAFESYRKSLQSTQPQKKAMFTP